MITKLEPAEDLLKQGPIDFLKFLESKSGRLYLTNKRLVFEKNSFSAAYTGAEIKLSDIFLVQEAYLKIFGVLPFSPYSFVIKTNDGQTYRFRTHKRNNWIAALNFLLNSNRDIITHDRQPSDSIWASEESIGYWRSVLHFGLPYLALSYLYVFKAVNINTSKEILFALLSGMGLLSFALLWNLDRFLNFLAIERGRAHTRILSAESRWRIAQRIGYGNIVLCFSFVLWLPYAISSVWLLNNPNKFSFMILNSILHLSILLGGPLISLIKLKSAAEKAMLLTANKTSQRETSA